MVEGMPHLDVPRCMAEILEKQELKDFYQMMPEKFNNKTNGITQRRFLAHGNPLLADWITSKIGDGWITDLSQISKLKPLVDGFIKPLKIKRETKPLTIPKTSGKKHL